MSPQTALTEKFPPRGNRLSAEESSEKPDVSGFSLTKKQKPTH
jgi:hypothetical protein